MKFNIINMILIGTLICQDVNYGKFEEMKNAFMLGLDNRALDIGLDIISQELYKSEREKSLYLIAEYFFNEALTNDEIKKAIKSAEFYKKLIKEYPNGELYESSKLRIDFLNSVFRELTILGNSYSAFKSNVSEVKKLGDIAAHFSQKKRRWGEYPLSSNFKDSEKFMLAHKYYDMIILNYPDFSVYGYYLKIKNMFDNVGDWHTIEFVNEKLGANIDYRNPGSPSQRFSYSFNRTINYLRKMKKNYPKHDLTLDLHLDFAELVINTRDDYFNKNLKTIHGKPFLQYIVENDKNKLGYRFNIAKEYIIQKY